MADLVESDGTTVWVHLNGTTVARFGKLGIDVHNADATGCLHCTHEPTVTFAQWYEFVDDVFKYYGIVIGDEHRPARIRNRVSK